MEEINLLFPTPVYKNNIGVYDIGDYKSSCHRIGNGYISNNEQYLKGNKKLKKVIDDQIENYVRKYLRLKKTVYLKHQSSWLTVHEKGDHAQKHYHSNSWLSGVYYPIVDSLSGNLIVHDRPPYGWCDGFMNPTTEIEEYNIINGTSSLFQLTPGDLFLFPSHVDHESERSLSDVDRVGISFNYTLHGKWGGSTNSVSLP
tara:strand:+ start:175 stop:774 length:600 start_codon:yes stop_codon:yes gene_type:complete